MPVILLLVGVGLVAVIVSASGGAVVTMNRPTSSGSLNAGNGMLGQYFSLNELTRTSQGTPNTPSASDLEHLRALVVKVLDPIRIKLGRAVTVTSGYRSDATNDAVGGSSSSQHRSGEAADIKTSGMSSRQFARWILDNANVPFDQLIWYDVDSHVHISYSSTRTKQRGEVRHSTGGSYPLEQP